METFTIKTIRACALIPVLFALQGCTINENDELEFTWLFWALLIAFIILGIVTYQKDKNEANKRGISMEQLLKEQEQEYEKKQMSTGFEVKYLGGYPKWPMPCCVNFCIKDSNIVLEKDKDTFIITKDMIVAISNDKSSRRSVGKTAAGAIVGGVLTGGIGLIVGGALGARKKDTSEVYITYKYNDVELTINLKPGKNTDKVYSWINSVFA